MKAELHPYAASTCLSPYRYGVAAASFSSTPLATQVRYEYDGLNRLRRVYCDDGDLGRYDYDASGRRILHDADLDHDHTLETHVRYGDRRERTRETLQRSVS